MLRSQSLWRLTIRTAYLRRDAGAGQTVLAQQRRSLSVLAIETSADDTCVALMDISQTPEGHDSIDPSYQHRKITCPNVQHKGIHPVEAVASHTRHCSQMVSAIMKSQLRPDLISVTRGPGMGGCLSVGVTTAKALSDVWDIPIVGVHHMQAHALTPFMEQALRAPDRHASQMVTEERLDDQSPMLTLLVSGKHTMLLHTKSPIEQRILATVNHIALGDVFDKLARELVPQKHITDHNDVVCYPLIMEEYVGTGLRDVYKAPATRINEKQIFKPARYHWMIPPPLRESQELKYEFSGLLGNALDILRERPDMSVNERKALASHTTRLAFEHLMSRVFIALDTDEELRRDPPKLLVLSGGVASNASLEFIAKATLEARGHGNIRVVVPQRRWCTDNAAMIAWAGYKMYEAGWQTNKAFTPVAKWSIEEIMTGVEGWTRRSGVARSANTAGSFGRAPSHPKRDYDSSRLSNKPESAKKMDTMDTTLHRIIQGAEAYLKQFDAASGGVSAECDSSRSRHAITPLVKNNAVTTPGHQPPKDWRGEPFSQVAAIVDGSSVRKSAPACVPACEHPIGRSLRRNQIEPTARETNPRVTNDRPVRKELGTTNMDSRTPPAPAPAVLPRQSAPYHTPITPRKPRTSRHSSPSMPAYHRKDWSEIPSELERVAFKVRFLGHKEVVAEKAPASLTGMITNVLGGWLGRK